MTTTHKAPSARTSLFLIVVTYLAFISLGLPDGLLGIAWPFMSARSGVPLDTLGILLIAFTAGYLSTSSTSGKIIKYMSLGMLLSLSCIATGLSLMVYALNEAWYIIIVASFFLGSGGGAIDSSINTFAAANFSASTVNWLHAFYGIGATTGPLVVTLLLANKLQWYHGYITVATVQIALAALFFLTRDRWRLSSAHEEHHSGAEYFQTLRLPIVWLYMLIFFLYTGVEQGFGQWLFTVFTKSRGIASEQAGLWTSLYWGSLTIGRIAFGIILTRIPVNNVLAGAFAGIVTGATLFALDLSAVSNLVAVAIFGIANAPVFPSLIAITPLRIGKAHTATAIGLQVSSAMLGGALVPGVAGFISHSAGLEVIPRILAVAAAGLAAAYFFSAWKGRHE